MTSGSAHRPPTPSLAPGSAPLVEAADLALAALLFAGLACAFGLGFQERFTGDGALLSNRFAFGLGRDYPHVLYLPLCDLLGRLPLGDPVAAPKLLSVLGAALGTACTYLLCRGFGAARVPALLGTLLLALSPVAQFFGTTIEVHAVHFGAVGLAACVTFFAPWRRPALALLLTAAVYPLVYLSHRSGAVLGLGWLLLVRCACERADRPCTWRTTLGVHGPLLLAVTLIGLVLANGLTTGEFVLETENQRLFIESFHRPPMAHRMVLDGWLLPLALLLPAAAFGFVRMGTGTRRLVAPVVIAPVMAYFFWWGVAERGGYFLGSAVFLAVLASRAFAAPNESSSSQLVPGLGLEVGLALVLVQALVGWREVRAFDQGFTARGRLEQAERALDHGGLLLSFRMLTPRIELYSETITEFPTDEQFRTVLDEHLPVDAFVAQSLTHLRGLLQMGRAVALDLSHERLTDDPVLAPRRPYIDALVAAAEREFRTQRFEHDSWPVLRLDRR